MDTYKNLVTGLVVAGAALMSVGAQAGEVTYERHRPADIFDHSFEVQPPLESASFRAGVGGRLSERELAESLTTVSITPNGVVRTEGISPEDLRIFKRALLKEQNAVETREVRESFDGELATGRSIIGRDTRKQVTNLTSYPNRTIGKVGTGCTGTLVGPRHVLTAAHCVFNLRTGQWNRSLDFHPAQQGFRKPYGTTRWKRVVTTQLWTRRGRKDADYAMVVLQSDIGKRVGWMPFGYRTTMPKFRVRIYGYPGDINSGRTMMWSTCRLARIWTRELYYDCDTYGGMSGSAVWVYWPNKTRAKRMIYGIHGYGTGGRITLNSATRIDKTVFNNLRRWKATY